MTENTKSDVRARRRLAPTRNVALLWDESFLWGLMAYKALKNLGLPFDLIRAEDIRAGNLNDYEMLFVPGGWASNKIKALGEIGVMAIRNFVSDGGSYLGFCGGAGLATTGKDGIGLLNIKRRPTKERVPSFSGRICLNINEHPLWREGKARLAPTIFHAWWPSQFIVEDKSIKILATYGEALPDAFSSDINVGDVKSDSRWEELEKVYQINLNPKRLNNEPAVIEGTYGKGKVILSLVHFDTPEDDKGQQVVVNLWEYLAEQKTDFKKSIVKNIVTTGVGARRAVPLQICDDLIALGERNFLWFWRNPMLLQWRRGVRGLEYNTLFIMMKEISEIIERKGVVCNAPTTGNIKDLLLPFIEKARRLLILERHALQKGHITYEKCDDPEIQKIRSELFSDSKSHGGMFKELIDEMDRLLFVLLKECESGIKFSG